ncbi:TetR/AcrR family transcriptional regulator [Pediococcus siamensis]|uniref:TetR/AcrR family transcriptional regulator n=1 Tax=Pediococcus siamensis TaxID=381829 RepID=UPI0039A02C27
MTKEKKQIPMDPDKVTRIMSAALVIFAKHGYRDAKTDAIAQKAEVSKGIIFRYYGNKSQLYMATLQFAAERLYQVADFNIWKDAADLEEMVVKATKYKIQLQLLFPNEFKLLLDAYAEISHAPAALKHQIAHFYAGQTSSNIMALIDPILDRLPLRSDVDKATIQHLILGIFDQITVETKAFMQAHPTADLTDFAEIIDHVRAYMDVIEHGFLKANSV